MEDMNTRGIDIAEQPVVLPIANSILIFVPFVALLYVVMRICKGDFTWSELSLLFGFWILTMMGTSLGLHRYFAHHSFEARRGLKILLGILGCAGGLGPIAWFCAIHRRHHRFSDSSRDPHSPNFPKPENVLHVLKNVWAAGFGFTYRFSLFGWYLAFPERDNSGLAKEFRASVQDLTKDKDVILMDRLYNFWIVLFLAIPGFLLYALTGEKKDFWQGVIWGGLARMNLNQLIFGLVNILGHLIGTQPFQTGDKSRNFYWFAPFSGGETLQNNHHAFPWTAKMTQAWWQVDFNYYFLVLFKILGWATEVRIPSPRELASKSSRSSVTAP